MSGLASLDKEASRYGNGTKSGMKTILDNPITQMVGAALVLKGVTGITDKITDIKEERKFKGVVNYARDKHPELKKVPQDKMMNWMDAFHTLSPKIAVNKELGASMLMTAHDYGGNIDIATAKMISDTGNRSGERSSRDEIMGFINSGSGLINSSKGKGR